MGEDRFVIQGRTVRSRVLAILLVFVLCAWSVTVSAMMIEPEHPASCHHAAAPPPVAQHHEAMAGHECCDRPVKPSPAPKKTCCPHPEGLAPRTCATGGECCRIEAREVTSNRQDRNERKKQHNQLLADKARDDVHSAKQSVSRARLQDGLRYERPVTQQKTDWRT